MYNVGMIRFRFASAVLLVIVLAVLAGLGVATSWLAPAAVGGTVALMLGLRQKARRNA